MIVAVSLSVLANTGFYSVLLLQTMGSTNVVALVNLCRLKVSPFGLSSSNVSFPKFEALWKSNLRPDSRKSGSTLASHHTSIGNPVIFCCISPLIVGRSAVEHPMNLVAIVAVSGGDLLMYRSTWWRRITQEINA